MNRAERRAAAAIARRTRKAERRWKAGLPITRQQHRLLGHDFVGGVK